MSPLERFLVVSALLFGVGLAGALTRRNAILALVGIELMLTAANLNFIAFWRYGTHTHPESASGLLVVLFSMAVAAAETAVGLALIIAVHRHRRTTNLDEVDTLMG